MSRDNKLLDISMFKRDTDDIYCSRVSSFSISWRKSIQSGHSSYLSKQAMLFFLARLNVKELMLIPELYLSNLANFLLLWKKIHTCCSETMKSYFKKEFTNQMHVNSWNYNLQNRNVSEYPGVRFVSITETFERGSNGGLGDWF